MPSHRAFLPAALLLLTLVGTSAPCRAQSFGSINPDPGTLTLAIAGTVAWSTAAVFLIADFYYLGEGRVMPNGWAGVELFCGVSEIAAGIVIAATDTGGYRDMALIGGLAASLAGGWLVTHAAIEIVRNDRRTSRGSPAAAPRVAVTVGAGTLHLLGAF